MSRFNEEKTLNAMVYLAGQTGKIDLYLLMKMLYLADRAHIVKWGRTITGDRYKKMDLGPVPDNAYSMINSLRGLSQWHTNLENCLQYKENKRKKEYFVLAVCSPKVRKMSKSDRAILDAVYQDYKDYGFQEINRAVHDDPAYKTFEKTGLEYMRDEDLVEHDPELVEVLQQQETEEKFFERLGL